MRPAARAFLTQFRSPYGATSQRSSPTRTIETGVDHGFPEVLPGTVRRCVRGPVIPAFASGLTTLFSALRQRLFRYGGGPATA